MLTAEHTLVVICGASDWPRLSAFEPAAAFANSATSVREYLLDHAGRPWMPAEHLLWLFDATDAVAHYDRIGAFLGERLTALQSPRGQGMVILVVYVGHGAFFGPTREYCLVVQTRGLRSKSISACGWRPWPGSYKTRHRKVHAS